MLEILVVEDEPVDQKLADLVLTAAGHRVTKVAALPGAREEIARKLPEVILLDLRLQDSNGFSDGLVLARQLKADPLTRHIAIVAVTAYPDLFSRRDALAAGCDGYILKPINTRTLTQELKDAVARTK